MPLHDAVQQPSCLSQSRSCSILTTSCRTRRGTVAHRMEVANTGRINNGLRLLRSSHCSHAASRSRTAYAANNCSMPPPPLFGQSAPPGCRRLPIRAALFGCCTTTSAVFLVAANPIEYAQVVSRCQVPEYDLRIDIPVPRSQKRAASGPVKLINPSVTCSSGSRNCCSPPAPCGRTAGPPCTDEGEQRLLTFNRVRHDHADDEVIAESTNASIADTDARACIADSAASGRGALRQPSGEGTRGPRLARRSTDPPPLLPPPR